MNYLMIVSVAFILILYSTKYNSYKMYCILFLLLLQTGIWYLFSLFFIIDILLWLVYSYVIDLFICLLVINVYSITNLKYYCFTCCLFILYSILSILHTEYYYPQVFTLFIDHYFDFILISLPVESMLIKIIVAILIIIGVVL